MFYGGRAHRFLMRSTSKVLIVRSLGSVFEETKALIRVRT